MIKFFRRIRQQLLSQNKFSKYMLYAIGEIVLVVIGILIALSINNWNEGKKLQKLEKTYLEGILDDLKSDIASINDNVIPAFTVNFHEYNYLDSLERNNLLSDKILVSELIHPSALAGSGFSFYPTIGTYNSIISEGKSSLIQDRELFNLIQNVYEIWYTRVIAWGARRSNKMDNIRAKFTFNFKYNTKLELVQNKYLLADLTSMYISKRNYIRLLKDIEKNIIVIIEKIEVELNNN